MRRIRTPALTAEPHRAPPQTKNHLLISAYTTHPAIAIVDGDAANFRIRLQYGRCSPDDSRT